MIIKHKYTNEVILEIESLCDANLYAADLSGADLSGANLSNANLYAADLSGADLSGANLSNANLRYANLSNANLGEADLSNANLGEADLIGANLRYADLGEANLRYADLGEANLRWCIGNMREIKSAQFDTYAVTWTKDTLAIGCQQHPIEVWWQFDDDTIAKMDQGALIWWRKWKPVLKQIIEMSV